MSDAGVESWAILITAIASLVTAIVALAALVLQGRRTRLSLGLENLWRLIEQWDQAEMRRRRAAVARALLADPEGRQRVSDEAIDVLNTFELLAYLVLRSKTLKLEDAWVNFSPWAISWYYVYQAGIERFRDEDPTVFEDYEVLVEKFLDYEMDRLGLSREEVVPPEPTLSDFLEAESRLGARLRNGGQQDTEEG
jgi:hypothetical protein